MEGWFFLTINLPLPGKPFLTTSIFRGPFHMIDEQKLDVASRRKCLLLYFYFIHRDFGLMHLTARYSLRRVSIGSTEAARRAGI